MPENTSSSQKGRIFISYRRVDSAGYAGRIYDRLVANFGEEAIFMDVDTIEGGTDFVKVLEDAVQSCDVLIALIGRQWLSVKDKSGKRRLDSPEDFVRIEIATALKRDIRVIPVLVDGVDMPQPIELPENLRTLARRNALQVNHHSFNPDVYRLIEHTKSALDEAEEMRVRKAQSLQAARKKAEKESAEKARLEAEEQARQKAEKEKAESETAEKAAREKVRLEAQEQAKQKGAREKAKREAAAKSKRERDERQATRRAKWTKTLSDFSTILKSTLSKSKPILKSMGIIGIVIILIWFGSWGITRLASQIPSSKPTLTQSPTTQIISTSSSMLPTRTQAVVPISSSAPVSANNLTSADLIVHYVDAISSGDGISYDVNVYLSVLESGTPIHELKQESLAIQEDGQKVEIQSLYQLTEEPINIVLVMDTSANMSETDMINAKTAATTFVSRLKPSDRIAFVTYDSSAKNQVDELTNDHLVISDIIENKTFATRENGACLYDAVYSALKMFSSQPAGSRAVVLLTNGKDETSTGVKCSDHTADEVLAIASEGELRVPLYIIGLKVDEESEDGKKNIEILQNFANQTGGQYVNLSGSSELANTFDTLSTQFRAQYILKYISTSAPGVHNVIVSLNDPNLTVPLDSDTRQFPLQLLPPHIAFISPMEDESISDVLKIAIALTPQYDVVERVTFDVNGSREGEDDTKPYEIELDAKKFPAGLLTISVTAYGANNTEIARNSVNIVRVEGDVLDSNVALTNTFAKSEVKK